MTKVKEQIDLQLMLKAIDYGIKDFYVSLPESQKNTFSSYVVMRWASATKNNTEHSLVMVNDLVNDGFSTLYKHPELQWKLISICGLGSKQYHQWIAPPKRKKHNVGVRGVLRKIYPHYKTSDLDMMIEINSKEDLCSLMEDYGMSDEEIKEVL